MERKTNFEDIGFYESVTVVIKDYDEDAVISFVMDNDYEHGAMLKFGDVLKEAKEMEFKSGTILLILESYLDGKIYRYGNYNDEYWYLVGETRGFA